MRLPSTVALLLLVVTGCATGAGGNMIALPGTGASGISPLRAGDRVAIKVWSDPTMTDTFTVSAAGTVALPRIGVLAASHMPAGILQDSVARAYTGLVRDPAVEVTAFRRIGVVGEVRDPGIYFSDLSMGVADVIALAGGLTENGNPTRVFIIRGSRPVALGDGSGAAQLEGLQSGDQIVVGRRNFWARNPGLLVSTVSGLLYFVISRL